METENELTRLETFKKSIGRPPAFSSPDDLKKRIEEFFQWCDENPTTRHFVSKGKVISETIPRPLTLERLALFLGVDRQTILNYTNKDEYFCILSRVKSIIAAENLEGGLLGTYESRMNALNMCSNYGYSMKHEDTLRVENLESVLQSLGVDQDGEDDQEQSPE